MRNLVSKIKPTCFNDLVASVALGRPGPINEANSYVLRKNGKEKVTYVKMDPEKAVEVVDKHLCKGFVVSKYTLSSTNL